MSATTHLAWAVALASSAALASAQTVTNTFTGSSPGDYNLAGNWSQNRVPGSDEVELDNVVIGGGAEVSLDADLSANAEMVRNLTINDAATFTLNTGGNVTSTQPGADWNHGWLHLGTSGSGHLVMDGGTLGVRVAMLNNSSSITLNSGLIRGESRTMEVGRNAGGTATITVNDGFFHHRGGMSLGHVAEATGIINQSGGELVAHQGGAVGGANGTGIWNLSGGEGWMANPNIAVAAGSTGTIDISGDGTLYFAGTTSLGGAGDGMIVVSGGGTLTADFATVFSDGTTGNRFVFGDGIRSVNIGDGTGTGLLKIIGNDATVAFNRGTAGTGSVAFTLGANGKLAFDIDDASVSPITISGGTTTLGGVIDLGLIGGYEPALGTVYDLLINGGTIVDDGLSLAAGDEALWSLAIVGTAGSGQTLQATYVPEPAGLALLGLAVPALLRRRRAGVRY